MSRKRISSAQTRSASTRLHDPDPITPAQQIRELLRVGDRLISVAVVYARLNAVLTCDFAAPSKASRPSYRNITRLGCRRRARGRGRVAGRWDLQVKQLGDRLAEAGHPLKPPHHPDVTVSGISRTAPDAPTGFHLPVVPGSG
jgi:hypothetical protein